MVVSFWLNSPQKCTAHHLRGAQCSSSVRCRLVPKNPHLLPCASPGFKTRSTSKVSFWPHFFLKVPPPPISRCLPAVLRPPTELQTSLGPTDLSAIPCKRLCNLTMMYCLTDVPHVQCIPPGGRERGERESQTTKRRREGRRRGGEGGEGRERLIRVVFFCTVYLEGAWISPLEINCTQKYNTYQPLGNGLPCCCSLQQSSMIDVTGPKHDGQRVTHAATPFQQQGPPGKEGAAPAMIKAQAQTALH